MAVTLLQTGGHLSLEFASSYLAAVRDHIRARYPDVETEFAGIATIVRFGGEEFTFQNEWDDPCLISGSAKGDVILRSIHAHFASESYR
ncbi:hypothetical protein U1839_15010 [Sphingomonas sp. RT2P30]|uniref:hypothetical protein n=1 Tax=Parasphingomonas halimpatiens TaxID=3096162 RepID=UPI002FC97D18